MLVLSRKPGEQIVIGDNIRITVVNIGPGRVKIGVVAPPTVRVDRQEVHEAKRAEQVGPPADAVPTPVIVDGAAAPLPNRIAAKLPPVAERPPVESRLRRLSRPPFPPRKPR